MPDVSPARAAALEALSAWRGASAVSGKGGRAEELLDKTCARLRLDRRDRALAYEILYGTIRNLSRIDFILSGYIRRKADDVDHDVRDVLRIAAYQVLFLDRVPAHAAVNDAVEQAKSSRGRGAASFVNGVLRNMLRHGSEVVYPDPAADLTGHLSLTYSYPPWLVRRWVERYGPDEASSLMAAGNAVPPLTIRANSIRISKAGLASLMKESGVELAETRYAPDGLSVPPGSAVHELPGYEEGYFSVQDEAAQLVSILLGPRNGDNVLDACAAPGGKAAHLSAIAGGTAFVLAADIGLDKSRFMKENMKRLCVPGVHVAVMDTSTRLPVRRMFDRVLLDAPCSALGIIRRRPEVKYLRREKDITRLSTLQSAMLRNVSRILAPGGALVYSVCTTEPEEGEQVVEGFLETNTDFAVDDAGEFLPHTAGDMVTEKGFMRSYPHVHGTDGFFAARLVRGR